MTSPSSQALLLIIEARKTYTLNLAISLEPLFIGLLGRFCEVLKITFETGKSI